MEGYLTPYEWKVYNVLVLPPGFPYGGMENPCLTFVTPSLIAGDRSLANVIAHEICHSWTGNLVTNADWKDFWLNEGFTMFLQRKIIELVYGEDMALLEASVGNKDLRDDIKTFGPTNTYTSLYPDIQQV
jgi:leukotriene-A4 hydrolase